MGWLQEKIDDVQQWVDEKQDLYTIQNQEFKTMSGKPIGIPGLKLRGPGILGPTGLPSTTRTTTPPRVTTSPQGKPGADWKQFVLPTVAIGGVIWFFMRKKK